MWGGTPQPLSRLEGKKQTKKSCNLNNILSITTHVLISQYEEKNFSKFCIKDQFTPKKNQSIL